MALIGRLIALVVVLALATQEVSAEDAERYNPAAAQAARAAIARRKEAFSKRKAQLAKERLKHPTPFTATHFDYGACKNAMHYACKSYTGGMEIPTDVESLRSGCWDKFGCINCGQGSEGVYGMNCNYDQLKLYCGQGEPNHAPHRECTAKEKDRGPEPTPRATQPRYGSNNPRRSRYAPNPSPYQRQRMAVHHPNPTPAPPAPTPRQDSCKTKMNSYPCSRMGTQQCTHCALQHFEGLLDAGCTSNQITVLCNGGSSPKAAPSHGRQDEDDDDDDDLADD